MAKANPTMPSYHQSGPPSRGIVQKEHFLHLYVHQIMGGSGVNQKGVAGPMMVNDWVIRDGPTSASSIVGHAQGMHANTGTRVEQWFFSDNIVFTDQWYNGSSIQFTGKYLAPTGSKGEWGIVGGSGEFAGAQGVASYEVIERSGNLVVMDINIRALCLSFPTPNPTPDPIPEIPGDKTELFGGKGGDEFDISEQPKRMESVTIRSGDVIDSVAFSYIDQDGNKQTAGPWGDKGGLPSTILLAPRETVNKVSGTIGVFGTHTVVTSLTIFTSVRAYGPYGKENGTPFSFPKENDKIVLGLFGRAGLVVDAIGAYVGASATK